MRILNEGARLADRYSLIRRLGGGALSEIWLATDRAADNRITLKFLAADAAGDEQRRAAFQREWRIGSRLMHPHIIRVFEYHDDADGPYFGQQFVGETTIGALAGSDPAEAMRPIGLVADALRYAHGKGIVHRDVKAANILLDSRGLPYLIDFGVAAPVGSDATAGSGSPIAMSPEQMAGSAAGSADDIFALGVLMHELLTGQPPGGGELRQVATQLADGSPMPTALVSLLGAMLATDPKSRPDAETVADRLAEAGYPAGPAPARFIAGQGVAEEVFDRVEPAQTFRRRPVAPEAAQAVAVESKGISPTLLYGGLGVALVLFLGVIFVLPKLVDRDVPAAVDQETGVVEPADDAVTDATPEAEDERRVPVSAGDTAFSENLTSGGIKAATDDALGDLLSQLERLRYRAIDRWGGQPYLDAVDVYNEGDQAYIDRNYRLAGEKYRQASRMLEPFFDRIDDVFEETLAEARDAFDRQDAPEAVRLYDLAVAITPGNREAEAGLARAQNLDSVLALMEQGRRYENDLELNAAKLAFEKALEIDALWEPAATALERVNIAINNLSFEQRMTEGFDALYSGDFDTARAAFSAAKLLDPDSPEPEDGLLQLDQEMRLADIRRLEAEAIDLDEREEWETSVVVYQDILKIDADLQFAQEGLSRARSRAALHAQLQAYIDDPDNLSDQANMQSATKLLLDIARIEPIGPRLEDQKAELSRLLKRAATPLTVELVSDNATQVSVFKVGRFGTFANHRLELLPGNYVAVGIRPGYRDVRVEFRVAPEIDMTPIVVQCEEPI
jgi:hypothetical protein